MGIITTRYSTNIMTQGVPFLLIIPSFLGSQPSLTATRIGSAYIIKLAEREVESAIKGPEIIKKTNTGAGRISLATYVSG